MKQIQTLQQKEIKAIPIPRYKELATKTVWEYIQEWPDLLQYFPTMKDSE